MPPLVLASTSRYRRELLSRLVADFRVVGPDVEETPRAGEAPLDLARRLAEAKALAVARACPDAVVIGSDQVAELDGRAIGKPGTPEAARAQLAASSGRTVVFHTALAVVDTRVSPARIAHAVDRTEVVFRQLGADEIARYVEREQPLDAAGSFKSEGAGIALFERIETSDPTALIGLPLIALARLLRAAGFTLP
ncbi:MAG TPA: Maf family nucleotide pyrophosphatase [Rhodanobacteraceae bacterium]|nr:Maf family nucleotide pyrophosphatase [Rhodanobacteraceae bacterium]